MKNFAWLLSILFHGLLLLGFCSIHFTVQEKTGLPKVNVVQSYIVTESQKRKISQTHPKIETKKNIIKPENKLKKSHRKKMPVLKKNSQKHLSIGKYNKLLLALHSAIQSNQQYPQNARFLQQRGVVTVGFKLMPSGKIVDVKLLSKSQFDLLNQAALCAVRHTSPFKTILPVKPLQLKIKLIFKS